MQVRIRLKKSPAFLTGERDKIAALAIATLLAPGALAAFTMAVWIVAARLHWTTELIDLRGILSRWQAWLAAAAILSVFVSILSRYGRGGGGEPVV
jgi:hypothetical protein